jgi:hypothetical protein
MIPSRVLLLLLGLLVSLVLLLLLLPAECSSITTTTTTTRTEETTTISNNDDEAGKKDDNDTTDHTTTESHQQKQQQQLPLLESWQENYLYMAPSSSSSSSSKNKNNNNNNKKGRKKGWGIYAAKSFQKGDVIEVTPMWIGFENFDPLSMETILNHYMAERWEWNETLEVYQSKSVLNFGPNHMFNHGGGGTRKNNNNNNNGNDDDDDDDNSEKGKEPQQNIKLVQMGDADSVTFGHYALRDIAVGEELLANYGGPIWFQQRGLELVVDDDDDDLDDDDVDENSTAMVDNNNDIHDAAWRDMYTSKIYVGHGMEDCDTLLVEDEEKELDEHQRYNMEGYIQTRVAPWDTSSGYRNARAKVRIDQAGTLLELGPALIMAKNLILDTFLEPIVLFWNDLELFLPDEDEDDDGLPETVSVLTRAVRTNDIHLETVEWNRVTETVLVPVGGSLALLERTTSKDPTEYNCRLEGIAPDPWNDNAFTIRIVSTKPIEVGERLVLKLANRSASLKSQVALWKHLVDTGQPLSTTTTTPPEGYSDDTDDEEEDDDEDEDDEEYDSDYDEEYSVDPMDESATLGKSRDGVDHGEL